MLRVAMKNDAMTQKMGTIRLCATNVVILWLRDDLLAYTAAAYTQDKTTNWSVLLSAKQSTHPCCFREQWPNALRLCCSKSESERTLGLCCLFRLSKWAELSGSKARGQRQYNRRLGAAALSFFLILFYFTLRPGLTSRKIVPWSRMGCLFTFDVPPTCI